MDQRGGTAAGAQGHQDAALGVGDPYGPVQRYVHADPVAEPQCDHAVRGYRRVGDGPVVMPEVLGSRVPKCKSLREHF